MPSHGLRIVGLFTGIVLLALTATSDSEAADPCGSLKSQLGALERQLAALEPPIRSPGVLRESPAPKPIPSAEQAQIRALHDKIYQTQASLDRCEAPLAPALDAGPAQPQGYGAPDPQIAVGRKFVLAADTTDLVFLSRPSLKPVTTVTSSSPVFSASTLFSSLFITIDKRIAKPPHAIPPNACNPSDPNFDQQFDSKHPDRHIPGCITAAYDTRILYDQPRHVFWIASAIRNWLWHCKYSATGAAILEDDTGISDPTPCHTNWDSHWAHRFIGIAVTRTDAGGQEDPSRKFFTYAVDDDYADWPQMAVHGGLLVLMHRAAGDLVEVYDAAAMAAGRNQGALTTNPIGVFPGFAVSVSGGEDIPVNVHDPNAPMLLFSANTDSDRQVEVVAISRVANRPLATVSTLRLTLPRALTIKGIRHNPVFRNGVLYVASYEGAGPCKAHTLRLTRIPLRFGSNGTPHLSTAGISDEIIASENDAAPELPAVEVTTHNDVVMAFTRAPVTDGHCGPFSARYLVAYHGRTGIARSRVLMSGAGTPPHDAGDKGVDLGSITIDPLDGQRVWFSHAFSNGDTFEAAFGAVRP
jgi:hypothetical protein